MNKPSKFMLGLLVLLLPVAVAAQEKPVVLKPSPGLETVQNNCGGCHSLDYIGTNSSYMNHDAWQAEVNKMINAFGAPIDPKDVPSIVDYLTKNYGKAG
ncbi:MAG: c-type cytochrome [Stellaceae bacterium]|jgi:hypothetical protein